MRIKTGIKALAGSGTLPSDYHAENVLWGHLSDEGYGAMEHPVFIDFGMSSAFGPGQEEDAWRWWEWYALGIDAHRCPMRMAHSANDCSDAVALAIPVGCPGKRVG